MPRRSSGGRHPAVKAAVLTEIGKPLEVRDDVEVEAPRPDEVRIRFGASGVCHSDLSMLDDTMAPKLPIVLGHEGAGVIEAVGEGVTNVAVGDHVVVSWVPQCGGCFFCVRRQGHLCKRAAPSLASGGLLDGTPRFTSGGAPLHQMAATGSFAEVAIIPASGAVKVDDDLPMHVAALLGCGVLTGVGAALNTADIAPRRSRAAGTAPRTPTRTSPSSSRSTGPGSCCSTSSSAARSRSRT